MLQFKNSVRVEQVVFAVTPPLVFATPFEVRSIHFAVREGIMVSEADFLGDDIEADAADA